MCIIYYLEKLSSILNIKFASHIGILIIDIAKNLVKTNKEKFLFNDNSEKFIEICTKYSFLIQNENENLSIILNEIFESLNK